MKANVISLFESISRRFGGEFNPYGNYVVPDSITPIVDVDAEENLELTYLVAALDLTAGAGTYVEGLAVPTGKIYIVKAAARGATTGMTHMAIDAPVVTGQYPMSANGTSGEYYNEMNNVVLYPSWSLGLVTTGNGADGAIGIYALVIQKDI